ncbi:MAG: hypothetical protein KKA07_03600 [Bacteroidetes bacterium]|nr:hypothetical protein [Bacteroidota bacterium]MBU1718138.1 hypothetical protein [Bacteroidota bacterium]
MKKRFLVFGLMCIPLLNQAQVFSPSGVPLNQYGSTFFNGGHNIKAIQIGHQNTFPKAALWVNAAPAGLSAPSPGLGLFSPGEVFRTDGPSNMLNA